MMVSTLLIGLGQCDTRIAPAVLLERCDERPHVKETVSFPQSRSTAVGWTSARRVLDWPGAPGVGACAGLVGAVDVCRCGWHVGIALLESVGCVGILRGLGLHHVGKARWLSNSACNQ
jgi:hypothetical protein